MPTADPVILGLDAMRTRFECVLAGAEPELLFSAGQEALEEIRAIEAQLSIFREHSWLSRLNAEAGRAPVAAPPPLYALLKLCRAVHRESKGAFDPSVGAALDAAGLRDTPPAWASAKQLSPANFEQVELLDDGRVWIRSKNLRLDLGGIAKGWALDRAQELLVDAGVKSGLLHAGTSSVCAWGSDPRQPGCAGWRIEVQDQLCLTLHDRSLSVSATHASSRQSKLHVIDPSTCQPLRSMATAAVLAPQAALADAWSTALLARAPRPFIWKTIP